uniref:Uncharacterized protein n=1 Tax=Physcomitrium patens TaxID=3218 RepID=A0A7I4AXJ7_PHYPA
MQWDAFSSMWVLTYFPIAGTVRSSGLGNFIAFGQTFNGWVYRM